MEFRYVGYTQDRKLVKGKVSAPSEEAALDVLKYSGYNVLSLQKITPFFSAEKLTASLSQIKPQEIIMFSRQLALLVETGTDIVSALDLLQGQITNRELKKIVGQVASDLRAGVPLAKALEKHPRAFSPLYCRTVAIAAETGALERGFRLMAEHLEKHAAAAKKVRGALLYPVIVLVLAVIVVAVLTTFVLPAFTKLYGSLGVELPLITRMLMAGVNFLLSYGLFLLAGIAGIALAGFAYMRTPVGRYQWDKLKLRIPRVGPVIHFSELARCCRTISLLFRAGVPLPEIMTLAINGAGNKVIAEALTQVRDAMLKGEGLSRPMARNRVFLPLMVQMAAVGEGTGNLDITMDTVAQSYEMEADDRMNSLIAMIQPAMTLFIGGLVGFIALALISTMYSVLGTFTG